MNEHREARFFCFRTPVLRYSEEPGRTPEIPGSSEYLIHTPLKNVRSEARA
jgi:hypothetical protein